MKELLDKKLPQICVDAIILVKKIFARFLAFFSKQEASKMGIIGSSNSVMRTGYTNYLDSHISKAIGRPTILNYYALGGIHSIYSLIQEDRHHIAKNNDVIFFEFCLTDRYVIDEGFSSLDLAGKTLEGFIRKVHKSNPKCLIVIIALTHLDNINNDPCQLLDLYESITEHYSLPFVDVNRALKRTHTLDHLKTLYDEDDPAHYTRPQGVKVVAQAITDELNSMGILKILKAEKVQPRNLQVEPIYPDNFCNLRFFDRFENGNFFIEKTDTLFYQNTIFKEKYFPIFQDNSLRFLLKGRLVGVFVKADLDHGFIKIEFNQQEICTSTYANWLNNIKPRNAITLVSLPLLRFDESNDFSPVSISNCTEYPQSFELEYFKIPPTQQDSRKWKLNVIGIAYIGELKADS